MKKKVSTEAIVFFKCSESLYMDPNVWAYPANLLLYLIFAAISIRIM